MQKLPLVKFFYPPDSGTGTAEISAKIPGPKTADDINDLFKEIDNDDKRIPPKESKSRSSEDGEEDRKAKKEDEEDSGAADDDELELIEAEEDIEKLDLKSEDDNLDIEAPPRKKEILKEYPELFKKFPFLEKMMYRDKEYTQLFGSFDDAKEIAEKSESFNQFESQLLAGNTKDILREVKESDKRAFDLIVDDYLPALAEVDKEAYYHVVGNLNKRLIMEMVAEANDTNNDDLKQAALLVNQFVFGSSKFTAPTARVEKRDEKNDEIETERLALTRERFETARDDLQTRVDNTLRATISDYIDPRNAMSGYVKKNAVADAMKILSSAIANDSSTVKNLDRLWRSAFEAKFSKDSLGKIQSFYLGKAKGNLKNAIIKARSEALKDLAPKKEKEQEIDEEETPRKRTITPGRPSQQKGNSGMRKGESVAEFFARD